MPFDIVMPKMGESVEEATITKWFVKENDQVEEDDVLLEIATDKVDSEIPSPVAGTVGRILFKENDVVAVGEVIAVINLEDEEDTGETSNEGKQEDITSGGEPAEKKSNKDTRSKEPSEKPFEKRESSRFYSPLVKSIAEKEQLSFDELESIPGSGRDNRVTKNDILSYIEDKKQGKGKEKSAKEIKEEKERVIEAPSPEKPKISVPVGPDDEIVEMDRMRKLIADHMVMSVKVSAHVTNMIEADVTNLVFWREKNKKKFLDREGVKLTYMPVFIEASVKALKEFPIVNSSVDGYKIIKRKDINMGIAVALPTNNLIVPIIKGADNKNLTGLAKDLDNLAKNARNNKLSPDDVQGGTFTITNFGTFKNTIGTPIINQPQVAILATGTIAKKPAVIETPTGDVIAIRHKMFISLTYDHRIIDGAVGGAFLKKVADYLESFDMDREV
jgi:2-oxoglutarate dehydrogenase E2 component (dihydrolipoamide succinyltransferase)